MAATTGAWPVVPADVPPWASQFHASFHQHLGILGGVIVTVTGEPAALLAQAARWEAAFAEMLAQAARLAKAKSLVAEWRGTASLAYDHAHAVAVRRLEDEAIRAERTGTVLRDMADVQTTSRAAAIAVTRAYLTDALNSLRWARSIPPGQGVDSAAALAQQLQKIFEVRGKEAAAVLNQFNDRMSELTDALDDVAPSLVDQAKDRVLDFFHYDVPERLREFVDLPLYQELGWAIDLGIAKNLDALIQVHHEQGKMTTLPEGSVGTYAGVTISPLDCAKATAVGAIATSRIPWLSKSLETWSKACLATEVGGAAFGTQPAVQLMLGWGPDSVLPDGAAARVGLRDSGSASTFWAGKSRAWAWQAEDHTVRFGCTRFDYLATPLPYDGTYWLNGTFATATLDKKITAGLFSEFNTEIFNDGALNTGTGKVGKAWEGVSDYWTRVKDLDAAHTRAGALFCGPNVNLYWR